MDASWIRGLCLSFPAVTEHVIWGSDLTFKVAGKMFAHTVLEPAPVWLSFKASPENFYELTERPGIIPAPYLARAQWVALETKDALPSVELAALVRDSYDIIVAKLPKKARDSLLKASRPKSPRARPISWSKSLAQVSHR
jgi:predicted DNA-binding protein (MmcQ/YjbR family)